MSTDDPQPPSWPPPPDVLQEPPVRVARRQWMSGWIGLPICGLLGAAVGAVIGFAVAVVLIARDILINHDGGAGWPMVVILAFIIGVGMGFIPGLVFWFIWKAIEIAGDRLARRGSRSHYPDP